MSENESLKVITLRTRRHYINEIHRFPGAGPEQFLELLSNADIVVTNSFHALSFSYIFSKKVALFKHSQFNERIENFIEQAGLQGNLYYEEGKHMIDFSCCKCDERFADKRKKSRDYLNQTIKGN